MHIIEFKPKDTLGDPRAIAVLEVGTVVGHIRVNPLNGRFQFFDGAFNQLNYSLQEADLECLKKKVEALLTHKRLA